VNPVKTAEISNKRKEPKAAAVPELLAPAGDWACARAAVENGADAVYFGLERFNARMRAGNFRLEELPELMRFLHARGARGYACLNTLIFTEELAEAEETIRRCAAAGTDAILVQDAGAARLIREISPDLPAHASVQMTVTDAAGARLARELGCGLVVAARECSLEEIAAIQEELGREGAPMPLEAFIHGALCVAYSGQCLTSESLGGRSANRGECAQACRLPFELVVDGRTRPLGGRRYLLSPQDLNGLPALPRLARMGVASLKIEGRLKSPEYVAIVTAIYREALDRWARNPEAEIDELFSREELKAIQYRMEMAFSRGLHTGWLFGVDNRRLVHGRFGKKRGALVGRVVSARGGKARVKPLGPIRPGDGVVFDLGRPDRLEAGGRVYEAVSKDGIVELSFGKGALDARRIRPGALVWKTSDPRLEAEARRSFAGEGPRRRRPVRMIVRGRPGTPMELEAEDEAGRRVSVRSASPLVPAKRAPLTSERLAAQLGRLGGTPFFLAGVVNRLEGPALLPLSELNRMRREAAAALEAARAAGPKWRIRSPEPVVPRLLAEAAQLKTLKEACPEVHSAPPRLWALTRSLDQLEAALDEGVTRIYCELEEPRLYREAVRRYRRKIRPGTGDWGPDSGFFAAPPRIAKPGEDGILETILAAEPDGLLARNARQLERGQGLRLCADATLNLANPIAALWFQRRFRLERFTASCDLNNVQLETLLQFLPGHWVEIILHQRMAMFHMEHCVFCAFLAKAKDRRSCGRPCRKHDVRLRDRKGAEHPARADAACRNTVYNARVQSGAEYAAGFLRLGARAFRIEFLDESPEETRRALRLYRDLLAGRIDGSAVWRALRARRQLGVTRGALDERRPTTLL